MTWRKYASFAAFPLLWRSASQAPTASLPQTSAGDCHTAQPMSKTPSLDVTALLERRGLMLHNRNREAAAKYVARHMNLIRER